MKLSLLICSLTKRDRMLRRLMDRIRPQLTPEVEILVETDRGERSIGAKRNALLERAKGEYVAFIDDDDLVSRDYVIRILNAIQTQPDCVGLEGVITTNGRSPKKFIHSLQYREWFERDGVYYRNPNHLNAIKRELALKTKFAEVNHGEDSDYSRRVLEHLKTEVHLPGPIYFYEFRSNK